MTRGAGGSQAARSARAHEKQVQYRVCIDELQVRVTGLAGAEVLAEILLQDQGQLVPWICDF
jgi:hypothetical protein